MKRPLAARIPIGIVAILAILALLYFFPLFRVRRIDANAAVGQGTTAGSAMAESGSKPSSRQSAATIIDQFWKERLPEAANKAVNVEELMSLAATDPSNALKKYGREVGLGGPTFLFVQGRGRIESVNEDQCQIALEGKSRSIILALGVLSGNAVRDSTGLIKVEDFANSQNYNNLSSELNNRCETLVIAPIRDQLVVGAEVEFAGCGKVQDSDGLKSLELIPVQLKVVVNKQGQAE